MRLSVQILLIVILGFFLELFMPWWAMITEVSTASDLADKVARTFMLHTTAVLLLVTFILAGLVGGFAAMSGAFLRRMIK